MDAVAYFKAYARMCDSFDSKNNITGKPCVGCPLDDIGRGCHMNDLTNNAEECVAAVEKWAKEHPERTRQSEFLKMFPNAPIGECGIIDICPTVLGECIDGAVGAKLCGPVADGMSCQDCAHNFWLAEITDGEA